MAEKAVRPDRPGRRLRPVYTHCLVLCCERGSTFGACGLTANWAARCSDESRWHSTILRATLFCRISLAALSIKPDHHHHHHHHPDNTLGHVTSRAPAGLISYARMRGFLVQVDKNACRLDVYGVVAQW